MVRELWREIHLCSAENVTVMTALGENQRVRQGEDRSPRKVHVA